MWVVFLLSAMGFAIAALFIMYIGNKILNQMKRDDDRLDKDINRENNTNEKENRTNE